MATTEGEIILSNSGNFVNRIGVARRRMWEARCVAVVAISIAVWGWCRPINKVIAERPINGMSNSECMEYAETMCNK